MTSLVTLLWFSLVTLALARPLADQAPFVLVDFVQGNIEGMQQLAKDSAAAGRTNVAFVVNLLLRNTNECLRLLCDTGRTAEAAFFARTYAPSQVPRLIRLTFSPAGFRPSPINNTACASVSSVQKLLLAGLIQISTGYEHLFTVGRRARVLVSHKSIGLAQSIGLSQSIVVESGFGASLAHWHALTVRLLQVSRIVALWRAELEKINPKAAESLADPGQYANLFPGFELGLIAECK